MSIAVSVIVRPSRCLRLLHGGLCLAVLLSSLVCDGTLLPAVCVAAAGLGWCAGRRRFITQRLDISGVGTLRLTVYQQSGSAEMGAVAWDLLEGSTVWPCLLLLRLARTGLPPQSLCILP
ncbi:MAG: hypothetical protein ACEQSK_13020, partial [Sphingomonadaceae bacterium]